jgi:glycosyltransferase involved in cell wall biosynthesis
MLNPLVSVVIPCYNQGHFLAEAINSVLSQTYPDIQIVVVNDGSVDNTEEVVKKYRGKVDYVYQNNMGLPSARNSGISASEGRFLMFLDSDDLLSPDAIRNLAHATCRNASNLSQCGWKSFRSVEDLDLLVGHLPTQAELLPLLINTNAGPVHSFIVEKDLALDVGGFDPTLNSCEDWDFWLRCANHGVSFSTIPFVGAFYRDSPNSMSSNKNRMLFARTRVLINAWNYLEKDGLRYRFGNEFVEAGIRLRRRFIAKSLRNQLTEEIDVLLKELNELGVRPVRSGKQKFLQQLIGEGFLDRCVISYYRWFDKKSFTSLREGFN